MESNWHRIEMNLLIDSLHYHWRQRTDYFAGGNMFIYFSAEQARNRDYRGPDFFVVTGVDGSRDRGAWIVWEENGRYPNVIIELASPSTIHTDLGFKKDLYERVFRTTEYFCYDPGGPELLGWSLDAGEYRALKPNAHGWLWSHELDAWLGAWQGEFLRLQQTWLRLYRSDGALIPVVGEAEAQRAATEAQRAATEAQRAATEAQRAHEALQRAEVAETEVARLRALLAGKTEPMATVEQSRLMPGQAGSDRTWAR
ncbi:MAG: Uma2 family endonuclease [Anaerolineae bacterium]